MNAQQLIELIKVEMKPSMGCTEPVAVGLAVSNTCCHLDTPVDHLAITLSSNIYKNAYSVKVPNTGKSGIALSAALGCLLARPDNGMELFAAVTPELILQAEEMLAAGRVSLAVQPDSRFSIEVLARGSDGQSVCSLTLDSHDNLVRLEKNGRVLSGLAGLAAADICAGSAAATSVPATAGQGAISQCTLAALITCARTVDVEALRFLEEGIAMNRSVAEAGLEGQYGLGVGRHIRDMVAHGEMSDDVTSFVRMTVAAACDCRMGGGAYSAMTVLGSGNQGFSCILPSATYGLYVKAQPDMVLRAVFLSILITTRIKDELGRLSPMCGAALAGAGSAGGIALLCGADDAAIVGAVQNMLGNLPGMLCDGAKDGCALKLSVCAGEAVMAARLAVVGSIIQSTDGLIGHTVEDTIHNLAQLSRQGMAPVDMELIGIMQAKSENR